MCHRGFCMTRDGTFRVSAGQSLQDQTRVLMIRGSLADATGAAAQPAAAEGGPGRGR